MPARGYFLTHTGSLWWGDELDRCTELSQDHYKVLSSWAPEDRHRALAGLILLTELGQLETKKEEITARYVAANDDLAAKNKAVDDALAELEANKRVLAECEHSFQQWMESPSPTMTAEDKKSAVDLHDELVHKLREVITARDEAATDAKHHSDAAAAVSADILSELSPVLTRIAEITAAVADMPQMLSFGAA